MKNSSLAAAVLGVFVASAAVSSPAFAAPKQVHSQSEAESIKAVMDELAAAVKTGDEQVVTKVLATAVQSHPKEADKIIAAFTAQTQGKGNKALNVAAIINNVIKSLEGKKGNEAVIAAILSSGVATAAGGNLNPAQSPAANRPTTPPPLPKAGQLGSIGDKKIIDENPNQNQTSGN